MRSAGQITATGTAAIARAAALSMTARLVSPRRGLRHPDSCRTSHSCEHSCMRGHLHPVNFVNTAASQKGGRRCTQETCILSLHEGHFSNCGAVQASAATSAARRSCAGKRAASAASSATPTSPASVCPYAHHQDTIQLPECAQSVFRSAEYEEPE